MGVPLFFKEGLGEIIKPLPDPLLRRIRLREKVGMRVKPLTSDFC